MLKAHKGNPNQKSTCVEAGGGGKENGMGMVKMKRIKKDPPLGKMSSAFD